jgi:hypothetical protein
MTIPPDDTNNDNSFEPKLEPRKGGQWKGKVWISPEFDAPDPEIERLFYEDNLLPGGEKPAPLRK